VKTKKINDPIYDLYELPVVLFSIIDHPIFQRLRDIKQLGALHLVFPAATHNRFEHCLGVCHLSVKWARHLQKLHKDDKHINITDDDILLVQIAALCHDLGHVS
jgi:HD superfamily phosphohydrolase